jgi:hypothetical protein
MPIKGYRPPDQDRVTANTSVLEDTAMRQAKEDLLPIIAQKSRNALNVAPIYIEYFQRLKSGRRCSCFGVETDPTGLCFVCFGTGVVGGYTKRGTKTEVFDVTYPNTVAANIHADYSNATRPVYWSLEPTSVYGTIEYSIPINTNIGLVDVLDIKDYQPIGTEIQYYIRSNEEATFVKLTRASAESRLTSSFLHLFIVMKRKSPTSPLPKLQNIRFSYKLIAVTTLRADIPRIGESLALEDFGITQTFSNLTFFLDNTLKNCTNEDFIINLQDNTRWKIVEVKNNNPLNITLSWDLNCRLLQDYEARYKVPEGILDWNPGDTRSIKSIQTDKDSTEFRKLNPGHTKLPGHRGDAVAIDQTPVEPGVSNVSRPIREV